MPLSWRLWRDDVIRWCEFFTLVWRRDAYYHQPAARWTIREAWRVAGIIAETVKT